MMKSKPLKVRTKMRFNTGDIELELKAMEIKYGMPSSEFYSKFARGELDDRRDFIKWAGLCDMAARTRLSKSVSA
ncbi:MAG: hypothetical protein ACE5IZ_04530 [Dehalococcoidia bacterium]